LQKFGPKIALFSPFLQIFEISKSPLWGFETGLKPTFFGLFALIQALSSNQNLQKFSKAQK